MLTAFLFSFLSVQARTPWQEGQKMDDLRRAYQRAVSVPLLNVEQLWREWDSYENGLNRVTVSDVKEEAVFRKTLSNSKRSRSRERDREILKHERQCHENNLFGKEIFIFCLF